MMEQTTENCLLKWFKGANLNYAFSHKFETLHGWHYFYQSQEAGKKISWEFFDHNYDGLKAGYCLFDEKEQPIGRPMWLTVSMNTDEGKSMFFAKREELELKLKDNLGGL